MSACGGRYRYCITFLGFFYVFSLQIATTNLIFAIKSMVNSTSVDREGSLVSAINVSDTCVPSVGANKSDPSRPPPTDHSDHHFKGGPFRWSDGAQTILLACPSFGQITGTMAALFIYNYCFLRPIISISLVWVGVLNILAPEIALKGNYQVALLFKLAINYCHGCLVSQGLAIARYALGVYEGILVPAPSLISKSWFLEEERDPAMTIMHVKRPKSVTLNESTNFHVQRFLGYFTGAMTFSLAGVLNHHLGWESIFRIPGIISICCGLAFLVFFTDEPSENLFIGPAEKKLLRKPWDKSPGSKKKIRQSGSTTTTPTPTASDNEQGEQRGGGLLGAVVNLHVARHERQKGAPLLKALTYAPVWAVVCGSFGFSWSYEAGVTYTQYYLLEMHQYSLGWTSFLNAIPTNLSLIISGIILSWLSNRCIHQGWIRKVVVRRFGGCLIAVSALYFVGLGYLPCTAVDKYIVPLLLVNGFRSGYFLSVVPSLGDISPTYQESLMTACTIAQFLPGFMVPLVMSQVGKNSREQWQNIFLLSAAIIGSSVGFYLLAATDEIQAFDEAYVRVTDQNGPLGEEHRPPRQTTARDSISSSSIVPSTRAFEEQGLYAKNVKRKWIRKAKREHNICKSVWNMDDEAVIETVLDDVNTDMMKRTSYLGSKDDDV